MSSPGPLGSRRPGREHPEGGPLCNLNVRGAVATGESLSHVVPERWVELPWPPHRLCSVAAQEPRGDGAAV